MVKPFEKSAPPNVAIVILNWMRTDHTLACLDSLAHLRYPRYRTIVVDNAGCPGAPQKISSAFPTATVIAAGRNLGFAAGCNVGIAEAMQGGADYILLLNDDTIVAPDLLATLVDAAESSSAIGIVGPKIYYFDLPQVIWSAGGMVDRYGDSRHLGVDLEDGAVSAVMRDVDYVTGCAMLVKRAVVERVGTLDERFFAYFEETEWCARARRAGFRVVCVPDGKVWHKIRPDERGVSATYLYLMVRNRLLYLRATGASSWIILRASLRIARTAASWRLRARHRRMKPFAPVLLRGIFDYLSGRFGPPRPTYVAPISPPPATRSD